MKIAFIGLGKMGSGMARNLIRAGHQLTVYNRSRDKAQGIDGAAVASSPAEACRSQYGPLMKKTPGRRALRKFACSLMSVSVETLTDGERGRINARVQRMTPILPRPCCLTTRKWWAVQDSNLGPAD